MALFLMLLASLLLEEFVFRRVQLKLETWLSYELPRSMVRATKSVVSIELIYPVKFENDPQHCPSNIVFCGHTTRSISYTQAGLTLAPFTAS